VDALRCVNVQQEKRVSESGVFPERSSAQLDPCCCSLSDAHEKASPAILCAVRIPCFVLFHPADMRSAEVRG
jgi:hypothetical protein